MDRLPIVYLRGFAGSTAGIDVAADDPFYGFNAGATHIRIGGDGDPMFYQSAIEAVRQWRYKPTILNGQPLEIDTFITVIYTLQH